MQPDLTTLQEDPQARIVSLSRGKAWTIVDAEDYERVTARPWYISKTGYAFSTRTRRTLMLHRFLMGEPEGAEIDHINGNRLDNRKANLRVVTHQQNSLNLHGRVPKSGHYGVHPVGRRFSATAEGVHLGIYATSEDAARAHDAYMRENRGSFCARYNFPHETESLEEARSRRILKTGCIRQTSSGRWWARVRHNGKQVSLGMYDEEEQARNVAREAIDLMERGGVPKKIRTPRKKRKQNP